MAFKLRFVQRFQESNRKEFMELEKMFMKLEQENRDFPKGKRYTPYSGQLPGNTLIWECEFPTLEDVNKAKAFLDNNSLHEDLYEKQSKFLAECYVEIYKLIEE